MKREKHSHVNNKSPMWGCEREHQVIGPLTFLATHEGLARLEFCSLAEIDQRRLSDSDHISPDTEHLLELIASQVMEYLAGERKVFKLPIDWSFMTPFQQKVLRVVYAIPYGQYKTYGDIAALVNKPGAARAVGSANAHNPVPLVIPCHRVVGTDRKLHGFSAPGGLATKEWLLRLEGQKIVNQKLV